MIVMCVPHFNIIGLVQIFPKRETNVGIFSGIRELMSFLMNRGSVVAQLRIDFPFLILAGLAGYFQ